MEQSIRSAPEIQIVLARIQIQEERVRNATRQLQDARDKVTDIQARRATVADRMKQFETRLAQNVDQSWRKQTEFELNEMEGGNRAL